MPTTSPTPPDADAPLNRAGWGHRDVAVRCATARSFGDRGSAEDLVFLVERALDDRSTAVRLASSTAAADVLSRHRAPGSLPEALATVLWSLLRPLDPGRNPGLLQLCGELRTPEATRRLLAALRDGRHDVRVGAVIGLQRHAVSGWCDASLEAQVLIAASDRAVPADTRAALVRLCADVGWSEVAPIAEALAASDMDNAAAVAAEALDWIRTPHAFEGLWTDTGRDAWETGPVTDAPRAVWAFVQDATRALVVDAEGRAGWRDVSTRGVPADRTATTRLRTLRLGVGGAARGPVILAGARVLVRSRPEERCRFLDALVDAGADDALDWIDPVLSPDATTLRARGRRALRDGHPAEAREIFRAAALLPRAPADLGQWIAASEVALGAAPPAPRARRRPPRGHE